MVAIITSQAASPIVVEERDEPRIAAPNQQVLKKSCGVSVWQTKCLSKHLILQKGF
jgi:hypothetical protein